MHSEHLCYLCLLLRLNSEKAQDKHDRFLPFLLFLFFYHDPVTWRIKEIPLAFILIHVYYTEY